MAGSSEPFGGETDLGTIELGKEPRTEGYHPRRHRDNVRAWLAGGLVVLLALVLAASLLLIWQRPDGFSYSELEDLLQIVFSPIVGLVGAATGFYFASHYDTKG